MCFLFIIMIFIIFEYIYLVNWFINSLLFCYLVVFWCYKGYNFVRRLIKIIMYNNSILLFELFLLNLIKRVFFCWINEIKYVI